jgi:hypothetical protein
VETAHSRSQHIKTNTFVQELNFVRAGHIKKTSENVAIEANPKPRSTHPSGNGVFETSSSKKGGNTFAGEAPGTCSAW